MSNETKMLKGIKFPGLSDTYYIPQVDNTLETSGAAADAKVVGEKLEDLDSSIKTTNETVGKNGQAISSIQDKLDTFQESVASGYATKEHQHSYAAINHGTHVPTEL